MRSCREGSLIIELRVVLEVLGKIDNACRKGRLLFTHSAELVASIYFRSSLRKHASLGKEKVRVFGKKNRAGS